jgi:hypothetical protein
MRRIQVTFLLFTALTVALSACSVSPSPTPESTTALASGSPAGNLVLLEDGLGPFEFGDSSAAVIEGVTDTIGGWDADSIDSGVLAPPVCVLGRARAMSWGSLILTFVIRDGAEVFTAWSYGFDPLTGNTDDNRRLALETPKGIGLGSARDDLADAYGDGVTFTDDTSLDTATFAIAGTGATHLEGTLDAAGPPGSVSSLRTSPDC